MGLIELAVPQATDTEEELRSLLRWLGADEGVGPGTHGRLIGSQPHRSDHMGATLDLIALAVSGGVGAAQLAVAIAQWRGTRRPSRTVVVRHGALEVEVTDGDEETVRRLAELLAVAAAGETGGGLAARQGSDDGAA
ncbi:effector-associated constant component EACC1 [Streptomyces sp. NPDC004285]